MRLAVLTRTQEDVDRVKSVIDGRRLGFQVEFSAAPQTLNYSFPFPVVVVDSGEFRGRYFGQDALDVLSDMLAEQDAAA